MKKPVTFLCFLVLHGTMGWAKDIVIDATNYGLITQRDFDNVVLDLGTMVGFSPMTPAKTLGVLGFDVSGELVVSDLKHSESWKYFMEDNDTSDVQAATRLHAQKGLPFSIDVGGMVAILPGSNAKIWGLEVKKGLVDEGLLPIPAVSVRASYSALEGVDDIELDTYSLDLLLSKDLLMFTPYLGLSYLHIDGQETSPYATGLSDVEASDTRWLGGLQVTPLPFCVVDFDIVYGEVPQYGLRAGLRF